MNFASELIERQLRVVVLVFQFLGEQKCRKIYGWPAARRRELVFLYVADDVRALVAARLDIIFHLILKMIRWEVAIQF